MNNRSSSFVLAVEARRSRFGYALFDGPKKLLDWGASMLPSGIVGCEALEAACKRVKALLLRASPDAIVVDLSRPLIDGRSSSSPMLHAIIEEADKRHVPLHFLTRENIRLTFRIFRARSKDEIAWVLVSIFPELTHRLPLKRKKWQPEKRGMIVFDAIATGLAFYIQRGAEVSPPK
jgi:hypothetical protein